MHSRLKNKIKLKNKDVLLKYPPELKAFALTLHFYSPRAYNYVRDTFNTCLPHERTMCKWYQKIACVPGFTSEALNVLSDKVVASKQKLLFSLAIDEMAIRRHVKFDGKMVYGHVNLGVDGNADDSLPLAKDAFTLLLVCVNENWKIPVGYFLTDSLTSDQKANIIKNCLTLLHAVNVISVVFDGLSSNISMAKLLGCTLDGPVLKTTFPHHVSQQQIAVILDPSHMIKLVRNSLDKKIMFDSDGGVIQWKFIEELVKLQQTI